MQLLVPARLTRLTTLAVAVAACACNSLTGANDLVVRFDDEQDDDDGDPSSASSGTVGHTGGSGGSTTGGDGGAGTTGTSAATSGAVTAASSSAGPTCMYPAGPYGVLAGDVVSGNLSWQGYAANSAQLGTVSIQEYFDCDGTLGVNALLLLTSAEWCGVCQQEASDLPSHSAQFDAKGVRVVTLMVEDLYAQPADTAVAQKWRNAFGLDAFTVVADPNFSFAGNAGSIGLPLQILVDPRTMTIVSREEGYSGNHSAVLALATANGG